MMEETHHMSRIVSQRERQRDLCVFVMWHLQLSARADVLVVYIHLKENRSRVYVHLSIHQAGRLSQSRYARSLGNRSSAPTSSPLLFFLFFLCSYTKTYTRARRRLTLKQLVKTTSLFLLSSLFTASTTRPSLSLHKSTRYQVHMSVAHAKNCKSKCM